MKSTTRRRSRRHRLAAAALLAALAGSSVPVASASLSPRGMLNARSWHALLARQYPSDAPACASLCIRYKIAEAADPGLATSCSAGSQDYVTCLCSSSKFTAAYATCLAQNCGSASDVSTGQSLFQSFCSTGSSGPELTSAQSVASSAIASQSRSYASLSSASRTSGSSTSVSTSTTTSGTSTSTSGTSTSRVSSTTTGTTTSGGSSTTQTSSGVTSNTSGGSSSTSGSGTSSSMNDAARSRALANATGVKSSAVSLQPGLTSAALMCALAASYALMA